MAFERWQQIMRVFARQNPILVRLRLPTEVQNDAGLVAWRNPHILSPLRNSTLIIGPDGVLSFAEKGKPKTALGVGLGRLKTTSIGGLHGNAGFCGRLSVHVEDLAANCAQACRPGRSSAASRKHG